MCGGHDGWGNESSSCCCGGHTQHRCSCGPHSQHGCGCGCGGHSRQECGCGGQSRHECGCGCHVESACCCGGRHPFGFRRRFTTREEEAAALEDYLKELEAETKGVQERLAGMRP